MEHEFSHLAIRAFFACLPWIARFIYAVYSNRKGFKTQQKTIGKIQSKRNKKYNRSKAKSAGQDK